MSTKTDIPTWWCVFKSKILELAAEILRLHLPDRFQVGRRLLGQVRSEQCNAGIRVTLCVLLGFMQHRGRVHARPLLFWRLLSALQTPTAFRAAHTPQATARHRGCGETVESTTLGRCAAPINRARRNSSVSTSRFLHSKVAASRIGRASRTVMGV
jgi:hypothetical protein